MFHSPLQTCKKPTMLTGALGSNRPVKVKAATMFGSKYPGQESKIMKRQSSESGGEESSKCK